MPNGGLTDEEAEEILDAVGFERPDEKQTIEIIGQCHDCGCKTFRIILGEDGDQLECTECGARIDR